MSIATIVTMGFGNGTLSGSIADVTRMGYASGSAPAPAPAPAPPPTYEPGGGGASGGSWKRQAAIKRKRLIEDDEEILNLVKQAYFDIIKKYFK